MNRLDELHKQFYGDFIVNDSADPETMIARTEGWANRVYDLEQENAALKDELEKYKWDTPQEGQYKDLADFGYKKKQFWFVRFIKHTADSLVALFSKEYAKHCFFVGFGIGGVYIGLLWSNKDKPKFRPRE